jgi:hypothetical protein
MISYAFARGEVTITASYSKDTQLVSIATPTFAALPDLHHVHTLVYRHSQLSRDQPDIQLDSGGLLKSVSTTTTDQTVAAIQNLNSLLTQIGTTQVALSKSLLSVAKEPPPQPSLNDCKYNLQTTVIADVTYNHKTTSLPRPLPTNQCYLELDVDIDLPKATFGLVGFPNLGDDSITEDFCNQAVCFRLTGAYVLHITATLYDTDHKTPLQSATLKYQVLAPQLDTIGFVRFKRRLFVTNMTTVNFVNGMVSEFKSDDPSEVAGVFTLPVAVLQTAAIIK